MVVLMANLASPICDLAILNRQKNPSPTPPLHWVIVRGLGHKFFDFLDVLEFFYMIQVVSWFRQSSAVRPCLHRICSIFVSESICFHICFRCFRIHFCFCIKIWKQIWQHLVPSVSAPFSSLRLCAAAGVRLLEPAAVWRHSAADFWLYSIDGHARRYVQFTVVVFLKLYISIIF
jgi:hypothetical protein